MLSALQRGWQGSAELTPRGSSGAGDLSAVVFVGTEDRDRTSPVYLVR